MRRIAATVLQFYVGERASGCSGRGLMHRVPALLEACGPYPVIRGLLLARLRRGHTRLGMQRVETGLRESEAVAIVAVTRLLFGGLAVVRGQ